jgi:hypothetical protein
MRGLLKLRLLIRHGYSLIRPHLSWGGLVLPSLSTGPFHVIFFVYLSPAPDGPGAPEEVGVLDLEIKGGA